MYQDKSIFLFFLGKNQPAEQDEEKRQSGILPKIVRNQLNEALLRDLLIQLLERGKKALRYRYISNIVWLAIWSSLSLCVCVYIFEAIPTENEERDIKFI